MGVQFTAMRVCLLLLCTLIAISAGPTPATAQADKSKERERGLLLVGSLGLNGCTGPRCQNLAPMVHPRVQPLFRINT